MTDDLEDEPPPPIPLAPPADEHRADWKALAAESSDSGELLNYLTRRYLDQHPEET